MPKGENVGHGVMVLALMSKRVYGVGVGIDAYMINMVTMINS